MKTMILTLGALVLTACGAASPVPADKLARAQDSLRRAQEAPAASADPAALAHVTLAKNQLQAAKRLMVDGHQDEARWTLMRAEADADVALELAKASAARADAQQTMDAIRQAMAVVQEGSGS